MRIHSISRVLVIPIVILLLIILYLGWSNNENISAYILVPALLVVVVYVFHGPLDHWWLEKFPVPFDDKLREWLTSYFPAYKKMDDPSQKKFEYRLGLYLGGRLFESVGSERRQVPEDIKCMIAAHGIHMNMGFEDYLIGDFDRIYLYKHPFPSPEHQFLHSVETNTEDGVFILSLEQLANSIMQPDVYFNIAYYAYAEAFVSLHPKEIYPDCNSYDNIVAMMTGWSNESFRKQTGFQDVSSLYVHISLFFSKPDLYSKYLPEMHVRFSQIFNLAN